MTLVTVSGGFDPIHVGHISLIKNAVKLGDKLVVILNNDNWLMKKKGYVFMPQEERAFILRAIKGVTFVLLTQHDRDDPDTTVCRELKFLRPDIFCNGGDRHGYNTPEGNLCFDLNIRQIYNVGGGKIQSSSKLVKRINENRNSTT